MANYLREVCLDIKSPLHLTPNNGYLKLSPTADFVDLAKGGALLDSFTLFPGIEEKMPHKIMESDSPTPMSPENCHRPVFTSLENSEPQQDPVPPTEPTAEEDPPVKKRRCRRRKEKRDKDKPKKSPSAYILWLTEARKSRMSTNISAAELTRVLAEEWRALEDKSKWFEKAAKLKKQYEEDREIYKEKMKTRIEEAISKGILHPNHSDNLYTLGRKLINRDSYDEMADPKKQDFCKQIRSISPSYYGYFEDTNELSSLSENEDWVLTKSQRRKKDREKERLLKKKGSRKKRDKLKPKKPATSYLLFLSEMRPKLTEQFPQLPMTEITTKISELWNACQNREKWIHEARLRKEKYEQELKEYEKLKKEHQEVEVGNEDRPSIKPGKKRRKQPLPKDPFKPKKPQTAFFLFLNAIREGIKREHPGITLAELTKEAGQRWKALTDKKEWEGKAQGLKMKHLEDMKEYEEKKSSAGAVQFAKQQSPLLHHQNTEQSPALPQPTLSLDSPPPPPEPIDSSSSSESDEDEVGFPSPPSSAGDKVTVERIASPHAVPVCYQQADTPSEDSDTSESPPLQQYPELDDHSYSKSYVVLSPDFPPTLATPPPALPHRYARSGKPSIFGRRWACQVSEDNSE